MRTYRGVVCEKKNKYTVFLTDKGDFLRGIPIGETPDIGDEVDFHLVSTPSLFSRKVKPRFVGAAMIAAAMIAAVLLFSIVASLIPMNDKVMAYVQLETDWALELGVDQKGKVISFRYLNEKLAEPGYSLVEWKGDPIRIVLDTAVKELSAGTNGVQVIITTIFPNAKGQQKVQGIVGSAVQEVRSAHKELNWEIAESTLEERVLANEREMSIHKFKVSQQGTPMNEMKPSTEVNQHKKTNSVNQQIKKDAHKNSDKQSVPTVPSNQKNNGDEKSKKSNEPNDPKLRQPETKTNKVQEEKLKYSPVEKGKSANPALKNSNSNNGNQKPVSKQPKENPNKQKQPGTSNSHGKQDRPIGGNDGK
ncbi:anti-sigma factor domain-containing protein [Sporosarcina sp. YIM B06819]|uniref:anti-sigma factor domain-containing protein n=1 Tax=Sporosarcina sp. YIM B06819 TaxID=3081769 RepID=UPI00298CB328|nr:anti-sigma factor domain-containing protein [Sporosarcina sp. YIM B06819]